MERITIDKNSNLKTLILDGLKFQEYDFITKTVSAHPIYLFYHPKSKQVAIYNSKPSEDEFILVEGSNPDKLKIIINEMLRFGKSDLTEIADRLSDIAASGKPAKVQVVYLSKLWNLCKGA